MFLPTAAEVEGPTGVRAAIRVGRRVRATVRTLDELLSSYA
ncbi:hypothetical protein [Streptomyces californicus]